MCFGRVAWERVCGERTLQVPVGFRMQLKRRHYHLHSAWEDKPGPLLTILNPMYLDPLANALSLTLWLSETEGEGEGTDRETEGEKEEQEDRKEQTKGRIKHRREEGKEEDGQS